MNRHLHRAARLCVALMIGVVGCAAIAQPYPSKPVRVIVGFPPGGAVDILTRIMAPKVSERWGQQVVVDNRSGAGSMIAAEIVSNAAADGYTLLMITASHIVSASLYQKLAFHPVDSFTAVTQVASTPTALLAHPSLPVKSVKELIALAKARPGQLNFGSSGIGSILHLAAELFKGMAGINIVHVPYKGAGPAYTDLIGGHLELMFGAVPSALPHVKAGKLRAIAVTSAKRWPALPEVPTIAESGIPEYEVTNWYGLLAPAGTARQIVERLHDDFAEVVRMQDVAKAFVNSGADPVGSTPQQFNAHLRSEFAKWTRVIKDAGVRPN